MDRPPPHLRLVGQDSLPLASPSAPDLGALARAFARLPPLQFSAVEERRELLRRVAANARAASTAPADPLFPLRCAALARLVLDAGATRGIALPASASAVEDLAAFSLDAPWRASAAIGAAPDECYAELVARFVARLVVEAFEPGTPSDGLCRAAAAILGQLGVPVAEARARAEQAWNVDAS